MSEMITQVAKALFLASHPDAEWSAGRARIKWFHMAEAAIQAMRDNLTDSMAEVIAKHGRCCGGGAYLSRMKS